MASFTDIAALTGLCVSLTSLGSVIYLAGVKLATLQVKVDTMWEFTLRRGKSEAVRAGFAEMNSPIVATSEGLAKLAPVAAELHELAASLKPDMSDADIAIEVERRLGDKILRHVCIPNGFFLGACLFLAIEFIKRLPERLIAQVQMSGQSPEC